MSETYCFPDTNIFLHYPPIDQVDWCAHLHSSAIVLVVAPVVLRELNRQKDSHLSQIKTRERAASALKTMREFSKRNSPVEIRESVELKFQATDPLLDFPSYGLVRELGDDHLVATILDFRDKNPGAEIALVTDDLGLELKAKLHQIVTIQLPATIRLPEEVDPAQKQIRELEEKVRKLQLQLPELELAFPTGNAWIKVSVKSPMTITPAVLTRHLDRIRRKYPKLQTDQKTAPLVEPLYTKSQMTPEQIEGYNRELEVFYAAWKSYLEELKDLVNRRRRTFRLVIRLHNRGSSPGKDIDIYVHFPDGLRLTARDELPLHPSRPRRPLRPESPLEAMQRRIAEVGMGLTIPNFAMPVLPSPRLKNVRRFSIKKTESYEVHDHVEELKHNFVVNLEPLYIEFPSVEEIRSFSIGYSILAANSPERQEGRLHVVFEGQSPSERGSVAQS